MVSTQSKYWQVQLKCILSFKVLSFIEHNPNQVTSHLIFSTPPQPQSLIFWSLLNPYGITSIRPSSLHSQITKCREKLLHLLLQHFVAFLGIFPCTLCVPHLYFHHGILLPLLVQFLMKCHYLRLQFKVSLLQAVSSKLEDEINTKWKINDQVLSC